MGAIDALQNFKVPSFLGITSAPRVDGGTKTAPVDTGFAQPVNYANSNLFAGNLEGVNTNIGIGDYQDGPTQAGYKLAGKTIAFA